MPGAGRKKRALSAGRCLGLVGVSPGQAQSAEGSVSHRDSWALAGRAVVTRGSGKGASKRDARRALQPGSALCQFQGAPSAFLSVMK